jgi:LysR family transcriptional regulator for metE and metH
MAEARGICVRATGAANALSCYHRCVARISPTGPRLDVRDLQIVLAVASAGSTAGASSVLHLTQSAVSRALLLAEDRLGARVFERSPRGLTPTREGERLLRGAGLVLAQLVELEESVREPEVKLVQVRLVCECYTAYRWLPSTLKELRRRLPSLEVTLAVDHTNDPVSALAAGEVDVALLTTSPVRDGLRERPLFSDEIVFVVATSHPLAARSSITLHDLRKHPLITGNTPAAEQAWFMRRVFGRMRPTLEFLRLPLTEAIVDATRAGLGIAVLSEWIAGAYVASGGLVVKRLASEPLRRPWRIAYRREAAEAARQLTTAIQGAAPHLDGEPMTVSPVSVVRSARAARVR